MKKIITLLFSTLFCAAVLADQPPTCPSAADMKTAVYIATPLQNESYFTSVDHGLVMVNGYIGVDAKLLLSQAMTSYTPTAESVTYPTGQTLYYCAYKPGNNAPPTEFTNGIYWLNEPLPFN